MTRLSVPEMSCGHCKAAIEKAVASVDADARVNVDLSSRTVDVESAADMSAILAAIREEGYEATTIG